MPANTAPIFALTPNVGFGTLTTANTTKDGTAGTTATIFTAGANGSRVEKIKIRAKGTNVATVVRVFINNGSSSGTATNNSLYMERTIAATTVSEVAEVADNEIYMNISLPAGYTIFVAIGTAVSAGLQFTCVGGNY